MALRTARGTVYPSRFTRMRESIEAMREIWTKSEAEAVGSLSISTR